MKRRTGLLFSSAIVVGLLGGAGTGFEVQKHRAPTPLPPIDVAIPAAVGAAPAAKADPATDDAAKLDGDLRKLLVDKPSGAKDPAYSPGLTWITAGDVAESRGDYADTVFVELNNAGFRRGSERAYDTSSGRTVEIELIQFRSTAGATEFEALEGAGHWGGEDSVPGTGGRVYVADDTNVEGDHWGMASFKHGTVVVFVLAFDHKKTVTTADLAQLAAQEASKL